MRGQLGGRHPAQEQIPVCAKRVCREVKRLTKLLALKLSGDIPPGKKPGDRYGLTEKVVANAVNLYPQRASCLLRPSCIPAYHVICGISGCNGDHPLRRPLRHRFGKSQSAFRLLAEGGKHSDPVLYLRKALVKLRLGYRNTAADIKLVGAPDKAASALGKKALGVPVHLIYHRAALLGGKQCQRIKPLAVFCQPGGYDRDPLKRRTQLCKLAQCAVKLRTVVDAAAKHYLRVQGDPRVGKAAQIRKRLPGKAVVHHPAPQLRICSVDRNVYRGDVHLDDAVDLMLRKICKRNEIAMQEGEPGVVVLEIAGGTHSGRVLVDEAEDAGIPAGVLFVHQRTAEFQPRIVFLLLAHTENMLSALPRDLNFQSALINAEAVIKHVAYFVTVY